MTTAKQISLIVVLICILIYLLVSISPQKPTLAPEEPLPSILEKTN